jgi:hypothetical protein
MCVTVSFCAFEKVRGIDFCEEEKLSQICNELEPYGQQLLPYDLNSNSVKFNVHQAITFLMLRHSSLECLQQAMKSVSCLLLLMVVI